MIDVAFNDVQMLNFAYLQVVRANLAKDRLAAMYMFQLTRTQADQLAQVDALHVHNLMASLSSVAVCVPRPDLVPLLEIPSPLASILASASGAVRPLPLERPPERRNLERRRVLGKVA